MNTKKNQIFSSRGVSLVELAFVLPLTFLFIFAGVEFSKSLRIKVLAQDLSREMANTLMRECVGEATDADRNTCIERHQDSIQSLAGQLAPGSRVYAEMFYIANAAATPAEVDRVLCSRVPITDLPDNAVVIGTQTYDFGSRIKFGTINCGAPAAANVVDISTSLGTAAGRARTVCVAEVYIPYTSILRAIPGLFNYNPNSFYAVTAI